MESIGAAVSGLIGFGMAMASLLVGLGLQALSWALRPKMPPDGGFVVPDGVAEELRKMMEGPGVGEDRTKEILEDYRAATGKDLSGYEAIFGEMSALPEDRISDEDAMVRSGVITRAQIQAGVVTSSKLASQTMIANRIASNALTVKKRDIRDYDWNDWVLTEPRNNDFVPANPPDAKSLFVDDKAEIAKIFGIPKRLLK